MEGYSEPGAIYFSIGNKTSFAKQSKIGINGDSTLIVGTYEGGPPYKTIKGRLSKLAKEFHAAEHQVYNCFKQKIKILKANTPLRVLSKHVPKTEEVERTRPFSLYCGTTVLLSSGLLLILSALPNIFRFHNTDLIFMSLWISSSIAVTTWVSAKIQYRYFLTKPRRYQIEIALKALKEALKNGNDNHEFSTSVRTLH